MKRLLVISDDRMMINFYREKLSAHGFVVETARNGDTALRVLQDKKPDLVFIDPVLSTTDGLELLKTMRAAAGETPMVVFTNVPKPLARAAQKAGATKILPKSDAPFDQALAEAKSILGEADLLPQPVDALSAEANEAWFKSSLEAAPEAVNSMRLGLHSYVRNRGDLALLQTLFREAHHLSERTGAVGLRAVYKMTSALENLIYDLYSMPEQVNDSTIRTVTQSIDFLATLFEEKSLIRVSDPTVSTVFAVEDDADARKTIAAAMEMVGLQIISAADPQTALSLLEDNDFDLIFLDVGLPEMSGFDLCKQVREIPEHQKTPVVFITGMATFQNRAQSTLSGGNDFIGKPYNLYELAVKALVWIIKGQLGAV